MNGADDSLANDWNKTEADGIWEDPEVTAERRLSKQSGSQWPLYQEGYSGSGLAFPH